MLRRALPFLPFLLAAAAIPCSAASSPGSGPEQDYAIHCAACHGPNRLGAMGPALLPQTLNRLKRAEVVQIIRAGLPATQMPAFAERLSAQQIEALADWLAVPPTLPPAWGIEDIRASHTVYADALDLPARPSFTADPSNLTLVVEQGDHHISVLDSDRLEVIHRFPTHRALHGGPKFTPDGRYVFWASRDGWVTKYDLWNLRVVAEVRAGINTRNLAVSSDGRYVLVANYLPHTLVALSGRDLSLVRLIPVVGANGKTSRVSAVYDARPRASFIAALKDIAEVWEIPYDGRPVYGGLVHDWQYQEAVAERGPLPVRRIELEQILDDFFFDPTYTYLLGASRAAPRGQVIHLASGRKIADLDIPGMPHLGSGITWSWRDTEGRERRVMASPNLKNGHIQVIDMQTWKTIKVIPTAGPGFFLRSHENTPYAWADVFFGENRDVMHVIDKRSLEIAATLRPEPG
ncbi:MAG: cytochrome D1 domain-containing protein, partial [Thiobacillaceae bacterium]